jgi:hypothetical protein
VAAAVTTDPKEATMAIGIYFPVQKLDASTYASVNARLADLDRPAGRLYHAAFHVGDTLHVFDVWEDEASFEAFGEHLMPRLIEHGVQLAEPVSGPVERIMVGEPVTTG